MCCSVTLHAVESRFYINLIPSTFFTLFLRRRSFLDASETTCRVSLSLFQKGGAARRGVVSIHCRFAVLICVNVIFHFWLCLMFFLYWYGPWLVAFPALANATPAMSGGNSPQEKPEIKTVSNFANYHNFGSRFFSAGVCTRGGGPVIIILRHSSHLRQLREDAVERKNVCFPPQNVYPARSYTPIPVQYSEF